MGHEDVVEPLGHDVMDAVVHGAVQAEVGTPDHLGAHPGGPRGDLSVVTGHEGRDLGDHLQYAARHPLGEPGPVAVGEHAGEATLGRRESLDRDQDGETH